MIIRHIIQWSQSSYFFAEVKKYRIYLNNKAFVDVFVLSIPNDLVFFNL